MTPPDLRGRRQLLAAAAGLVVAACAPGRKTTSPASTGSFAPSSTSAGDGAPGLTTSTSTNRSGTAPGPASFIRSGPASSKAVALTFHVQGPIDHVRPLFDEARQLRVPLTLFLVGTFVKANPAYVAALAQDGHEIANHTANHRRMSQLSESQIADEIGGCKADLEKAVGSPGAWFRPSGMDIANDLVLRQAALAGYHRVIGFDVDPSDYQNPGATAVEQRVKSGLHSGAIVSMHTDHQGTVAALGPIVDAIRAAGLELRTVTGLVGA